jgi:DNA-binding XRE family transcriptional regulator
MNLKLADYRIKAGYTQEKIAEELEIATSTYNQYETGKRNIPTETMEKLINTLKIRDKNIFYP